MNLTYARFMSICLSCLSKLLTDRKWQTALLRPGWPGWPGLANGPVRAVWPFGPALAYYEFILSIFPLTGLKSRQDLKQSPTRFDFYSVAFSECPNFTKIINRVDTNLAHF